MEVLIEGRGVLPLVREHAGHRLRFATRRLLAHLLRAKVIWRDDNGPRGGVDKQCRIELHLRHGGTLQVTARAADWAVAFAQALQRVQRALIQHLQRAKPRHSTPVLT
jgi:ribosome-associated translation inhibitor RaiA